MWALRRRPHNTLDRWDGTWYERTLLFEGRTVVVATRQIGGGDNPRLVVELRSQGARLPTAAADGVCTILDRTLGLHTEIGGFADLARTDPRLEALAARFQGMRPPRFPSVFESLVNAIACQQLSLTVGIHLLNRLAERYSATAANASGPGFPEPDQLASARVLDLQRLGFSRSKALALQRLARRVASGTLDLERLEGVDDDAARSVLMGINGVGRWSTEYVLLRGLGRLHVLPGDDVGARNNLRRHFDLDPSADYEAVANLARRWWPYAGLVYFHLLLDSLADAQQVIPGSMPPSGAVL